VAACEHGQGGVAVLCSAGLDSAVLLADVARSAAKRQVQPIYVSVGLAWESGERAALEALLTTPPFESVSPVASLRFDMRDVYPPTHWAIRGTPPAFDTPDEDVYLEGRNIVLLTKAAVYMTRHGLTRVCIGPLAGNPFPDATPEFFEALARSLSIGLASPIDIEAPFAGLQKTDVIRLGQQLGVPLDLTLSCMQPPSAGMGADVGSDPRFAEFAGERSWTDAGARAVHCGRCSKCRERRDAFREAGVEDPTRYAVTPAR
jgi:7-cyano-7-deazaguanine synthase